MDIRTHVYIEKFFIFTALQLFSGHDKIDGQLNKNIGGIRGQISFNSNDKSINGHFT